MLQRFLIPTLGEAVRRLVTLLLSFERQTWNKYTKFLVFARHKKRYSNEFLGEKREREKKKKYIILFIYLDSVDEHDKGMSLLFEDASCFNSARGDTAASRHPPSVVLDGINQSSVRNLVSISGTSCLRPWRAHTQPTYSFILSLSPPSLYDTWTYLNVCMQQ